MSLFGLDPAMFEEMGKQFERIVIASERLAFVQQCQTDLMERHAIALERQAAALETISQVAVTASPSLPEIAEGVCDLRDAVKDAQSHDGAFRTSGP